MLMPGKYNDLLRLNDEIYEDSKKLSFEQEKVVHSVDRTVNICENNRQIIDLIENDFLKKTKLQRKDISFLDSVTFSKTKLSFFTFVMKLPFIFLIKGYTG